MNRRPFSMWRGLIIVGWMLLPGVASAADIFDAARAGDRAAIAAYVAAGGEVDVRTDRGFTPFILAAYNDQQAAAADLLKEGADACAVDAQGSNAFMGVAFRGHQRMAEWLLREAPCDVNHRNHAGQTALMMASLFGREAMVELLLEHGADASIVDAQGNTAQSLAAGQGLTGLVAKLKFLRP